MKVATDIFGDGSIISEKFGYRYLNGNYIVEYRNWDRKLTKRSLRVGEPLVSSFPDSIDLKITNKCSWGCPFCHENSTSSGKLFDLEDTKKTLLQLPNVPIELAIGGGNIFECSEETLELLKWIIKDTAFLPRITVNYKDIEKYDWLSLNSDKVIKDIVNLVGGVGISIDKLSSDFITNKDAFYTWWQKLGIIRRHNPVVHIIAGVFPPKDFENILEQQFGFDLLILGFKQFGRAKNMTLPREIEDYREILKKYMSTSKYFKSSISFDNLALEQLGIRDLIGEDEFEVRYMGDEGQHSMYIDAVERTFARTSRSPKRESWDDITLLDFFRRLGDDKYNY